MTKTYLLINQSHIISSTDTEAKGKYVEFLLKN